MPRALVASLLLPLAGLCATVACSESPGSRTSGEASGSTSDAAVAALPPLPDEARILAEIDRSRGVKDCFLPLVDPDFLPADGPHGVADDEYVLGLDLAAPGMPPLRRDAGGASPATAVCYPTLLLNEHEIVEHRMAGLGLLACW
jgi:hypothetical protein